ncbi:ankyrin repeat and SOCS box protein 8-like [Branchiostoma lanceolatum]|uniref:ankyrin repeat and SOCS box protein 8-like n=1 Tax=Branchiostoma lanceolatum TaxID=7740 RepID=UPI0034519B06
MTMWYIMENTQTCYELNERLIHVICDWEICTKDDVEDLINKGADINCVHGTLRPLHCACMVSDARCAEMLLERGADVNSKDGYGRTALHYAAEKDSHCVSILLQHGAFINAPDGNQDTPLHWAAFRNNAPCLKILLQHGAMVNSLDYNSDTPLSWASMKGNLEAVEILLQYGAEVRTENDNGYSPVYRASLIQARGLNDANDDESLDLLIRASGQFDLRNEDGQMPNEIVRDNQLCDRLLELSTNPRTLKDLCMYKIRKSIGETYLPKAVKKLPLPEYLKRFLCLKN